MWTFQISKTTYACDMIAQTVYRERNQNKYVQVGSTGKNMYVKVLNFRIRQWQQINETMT